MVLRLDNRQVLTFKVLSGRLISSSANLISQSQVREGQKGHVPPISGEANSIYGGGQLQKCVSIFSYKNTPLCIILHTQAQEC